MGGSIGTGSGPYRENTAEQQLEWYERCEPSPEERQAWVQMWSAAREHYDRENSCIIADNGMTEYRKRFGLPK